MADQSSLSGRRLFLARLAIGIAQGLTLYLLYKAQDGDNRVWPATNGLAFEPLLLCWVFMPVLLSSALGEIRWQRAGAWFIAATLILGSLALYDNWSAWPTDWVYVSKTYVARPHIMPSARLFFLTAAGLFIAHALVIGGHADQRFRATYPRHFDIAWKLALQVALTGLFVGIFWLLLWLGASLFNLIKLDFFEKLIEHEWFSIPATTLAGAVALHLTDIRPALVRGARTLLLTLLSWLLPLPALIVAGFLASLPFTGLAPLWSVGHASMLLLGASAALIILVNAAHQDGDPERMPPLILRLAGSIAAILPLPLSLIAAYALFLRVQQYGWTADRVVVAASVLVAMSYAAGYVRAAIPRGSWLHHIEAWNFYVALLILAVLLALLTPVMNPARIAVADQMARLNVGKTAPEKFDGAFLQYSGGRYGLDALQTLEKSESALLRSKAENALAPPGESVPIQTTPEMVASQIKVYPQGAKLPWAFLTTLADSRSHQSLNCQADCEATMVDLDGDGFAEIIVYSATRYASAQFFRDTGNGAWHEAGSIAYPYNCLAVLESLRSGQYQLVRPRWNDLVAGSLRLHVTDKDEPSYNTNCPKLTAEPKSGAPAH